MMNGTMIQLLIVVLYSVLLPVGLMLWWRRRSGEGIWPFFVGAICFGVFALVLENLVHGIFLTGQNEVSKTILASPVLYTLYTALAAGLFEETGRLVGYTLFLKGRREPECAVAYGIGHGGIEVILILGMTYAVYLAAKCGASFGTEETNAMIRTTADSIAPLTSAIAMLERLSALMAHVGLSMIVFTAVRQQGKSWLYLLAILLHGILDVPAALFQTGVIEQIWVVESFAFVTGLVYLLLGRRIVREVRE